MQESNNTEDKKLTLYGISPKTDCPHIGKINLKKVFDYFEISLDKSMFVEKCENCEETSENWLCIACFDLFCSRYKNKHMSHHYEQTEHGIGLSLSDGSFWCFDCDSYIDSKDLNNLRIIFSDKKFGVGNDLEDLANQLDSLNIKSDPIEELAEIIKSQNKSKIGLFTGAGISVSSGIPDFRSKGGLFQELLEKFNESDPTKMLSLNYYKNNPEPFNTLCMKMANNDSIHPSTAHFFHKLLESEKKLLIAFTQNIDSLEIKAGLNANYLVQAHGHFRSTTCLGCKKKGEIKAFMDELNSKGETNLLICKDCEGIIKPDVVLYGEKLPDSFYKAINIIPNLDLAIVMGTSLIVAPFSLLPETIPVEVPIFIFNKEKIRIPRKNVHHIMGDLDENLVKLIEKLGLKEKFDGIKEEYKSKSAKL